MQTKLDKYLSTTKFTHIREVCDAFELCENFDDVQKVIGEIPNKFGSFIAELTDDENHTYNPDSEEAEKNAQIITGFRITNIYCDFDDDTQEDIYDFDWYEG